MTGLFYTLIDTDIGDDVDDAFALALATRLPALRLVGVTTVAGPVAQRAELAQYVLAVAGQPQVPVVAGSSTSRNGRPGSARFSHAQVLTAATQRTQHDRDRSPRPQRLGGEPYGLPSTEFILECSRTYSPLTIIALGPLTNIAAALDADPTLAQRARLVAMAGKLGLPYPDWNLRCDPAAARRVLAAGMPITLVGMHLTLRTQLPARSVQRLFAQPDPLSHLLARCILAWRTPKRRLPFLHDPLTVAVAADPSLVRRVPRRVAVLPAGFSLALRHGLPNALVCPAVDIRRFFTLFSACLIRA